MPYQWIQTTYIFNKYNNVTRSRFSIGRIYLRLIYDRRELWIIGWWTKTTQNKLNYIPIIPTNIQEKEKKEIQKELYPKEMSSWAAT